MDGAGPWTVHGGWLVVNQLGGGGCALLVVAGEWFPKLLLTITTIFNHPLNESHSIIEGHPQLSLAPNVTQPIPRISKNPFVIVGGV